MITSAFLNFSFYILNWVIQIFPTSSGFSASIHSAFQTLGGYVGMFTGLLPYGTLTIVMGIVIVVEIIIWGWKTIKWIISHIPYIGGHGV